MPLESNASTDYVIAKHELFQRTIESYAHPRLTYEQDLIIERATGTDVKVWPQWTGSGDMPWVGMNAMKRVPHPECTPSFLDFPHEVVTKCYFDLQAISRQAISDVLMEELIRSHCNKHTNDPVALTRYMESMQPKFDRVRRWLESGKSA